MGDEVEVDADRVELETKAKRMGWAPKEQWRGNPEQWRDADEYVRRSEEILPIVNANNRKLTEQLEAANRELQALKGTLTAQQQSMKDLLEHQASEIKRQVEDQLKTLRKDKTAAIKDGDHERAAEIEEEIDATKDRLAQASKAPAPPPPASAPTAPKVEPWAQAFADENAEWLTVDKRKTALFQGIAEDLFSTTNLRAGALLEEAKKQMEVMLGKPAQRMAKSEGGSGGWEGTGSGGSPSGAKTFAALPQEAKDACLAQAKKFVGESGKAFKTEAEWKKHYAETYFASQRN